MSKYEFLNILKKTLQGEVTEAVINENNYYYSNYIDSEINKGKSESEVLHQLGDPRLIAKTIIETNSIVKNNGTYTYSNANEDTSEEEHKRNGFNANFDEHNGWDIRFGKFKLNTWYGKSLVVIFAIILLLAIGQLAITILPIILPIIIVFWLITYLTGGRR